MEEAHGVRLKDLHVFILVVSLYAEGYLPEYKNAILAASPNCALTTSPGSACAIHTAKDK